MKNGKHYFICGNSHVAERLAHLAYEGKIASLYRSAKAAATAYNNYPASLRYRYGVFETLLAQDGTLTYCHEIGAGGSQY